jgi:hypothetical protein
MDHKIWGNILLRIHMYAPQNLVLNSVAHVRICTTELSDLVCRMGQYASKFCDAPRDVSQNSVT